MFIQALLGNGYGDSRVKPTIYGVRLWLPSMERLKGVGALELVEGLDGCGM